MQLIFYFLSAILIYLTLRTNPVSNKIISAIIAFLWLFKLRIDIYAITGITLILFALIMAAFQFGILEDIGMIVAGIVTVFLLIYRNRILNAQKQYLKLS